MHLAGGDGQRKAVDDLEAGDGDGEVAYTEKWSSVAHVLNASLW
jgi:hypothetical protein